jgi:hypothetical protein
MADLVGSDVPTGDEVKWYYSGKAATFVVDADYTLNGASVTIGIIALKNTAEFGLVWGEVTRAGTTYAVGLAEYSRHATAFASNTTNTKCVHYAGMQGSDVLSVKYINVSTTALTHIASCRDVKTSRSIDTKSTSVQGQQNKLKKTGAADLTADLSEVTYSQTFLSALYGDEVTAAATLGYKWADITTGIHKLGCIIGKRYVNNAVVKKWALLGVQPSALNENFPTEDYYTRDLSLVVDNLFIWDNE